MLILPKFQKQVIGGLALAAAVGATSIYRSRRASSQIQPGIQPEGTPKDKMTLLLEIGSKVMQSKEPLKGNYTYLVGFHPMKDNPRHQMEAHHYCKQLNEDFAQCLLFDGNTRNANLTGIEYIISEKLFDELPKNERQFWHPHGYEILSGQLVAPGLPNIAEKQLMKKKVNSYGKTFHTWRAKCWEGEKPFIDKLPMGEAVLAWSFNQDGEAKHELIEARDKNMGISTDKKRQKRASLKKDAKPQEGINTLASNFKSPIHPRECTNDASSNNHLNSEKPEQESIRLRK